jgi:hypothetical protein
LCRELLNSLLYPVTSLFIPSPPKNKETANGAHKNWRGEGNPKDPERLVKLKRNITMLQVYVTYTLKYSQAISCIIVKLKINIFQTFCLYHHDQPQVL